MLHYVRGDGGMIVVPVEELVRWLDAAYETHVKETKHAAARTLDKLLTELEAMGR